MAAWESTQCRMGAVAPAGVRPVSLITILTNWAPFLKVSAWAAGFFPTAILICPDDAGGVDVERLPALGPPDACLGTDRAIAKLISSILAGRDARVVWYRMEYESPAAITET